MKCPNCGFSQPPSLSCNQCGIIFAKFQGKRPPRPAPTEGEGEEKAPVPTIEGKRKGSFGRLEPTTSEVLDTPISTSAVITRILAGLGAIGIAILMFQAGAGLKGFLPYALMCCYLGAGLWSIATLKTNVTIRQFAMEITILVLVSATVRILYPQVFSVEHDELKREGEILVATNDYAQYLTEARGFEDSAAPFMAPLNGAVRGSRSALDQSWMDIRTTYTRNRMYDARKAMEMNASYRNIRAAYEHLSRNLKPEACSPAAPCKSGSCAEASCRDHNGGLVLLLPEPEQAIVQDHLKAVEAACTSLRQRGEHAPGELNATTAP